MGRNKVDTRAELKRRSGGSMFNEKVNDKPRLSYSEGLAREFKRHPPRKMVEPMFHGRWHTVDDYKDLGEEFDG